MIQELKVDPVKLCQQFRKSVRQFQGLLCQLASCLPSGRTFQCFDVTSSTTKHQSDWSEGPGFTFSPPKDSTHEWKNMSLFHSANICCQLFQLTSNPPKKFALQIGLWCVRMFRHEEESRSEEALLAANRRWRPARTWTAENRHGRVQKVPFVVAPDVAAGFIS